MIGNMVNMKYSQKAGVFSYPKCYEEFETEDEGLNHMLHVHDEAKENME
jgi:hypothetical protein